MAKEVLDRFTVRTVEVVDESRQIAITDGDVLNTVMTAVDLCMEARQVDADGHPIPEDTLTADASYMEMAMARDELGDRLAEGALPVTFDLDDADEQQQARLIRKCLLTCEILGGPGYPHFVHYLALALRQFAGPEAF